MFGRTNPRLFLRRERNVLSAYLFVHGVILYITDYGKCIILPVEIKEYSLDGIDSFFFMRIVNVRLKLNLGLAGPLYKLFKSSCCFFVVVFCCCCCCCFLFVCLFLLFFFFFFFFISGGY